MIMIDEMVMSILIFRRLLLIISKYEVFLCVTSCPESEIMSVYFIKKTYPKWIGF